MDFLIKALQLILSLSILVILHEFGHFFFARLFKTRVEKFYLFFNPGFSLFKFKKGDTEYGLGWLPLGGYVKISGMIDESMDKEQLKEEPKSWEFRSKPAWQRLLIMVGGVLVNFITALVIFWLILFKWGESYIPAENARYGLYFHPIAQEMGLQEGDRVLKVGTHDVETVPGITRLILLEDASEMTVERNGEQILLPIPSDINQRILAAGVRTLADFRIPIVVDTVIPGSGAFIGGLQKNDSIVGVDNVETPFFHQFTAELANHRDKETLISLYRDGNLYHLNMSVDESGKLGFGPKGPTKLLGARQLSYGFFEAMPAGINKGVNLLTGYVKQLKLVFSREGAKQIGGFGTIGSLFAPVWDWESFWYTTAFLSIILAFMNILPIPALDGGHVLFLIYEIVARRKPSDKFMEHAQMVGMVLLLGLLIWANGNDLYRWIFK
ncbi:RIP metalloprotease RseP [Alkaliflexus imshenetskii]|uniref:RIP metalloprotease RseP n=1 Tax=Alkaliflexus imshenetskii TaxID=286730 RepID=UPI00047E2743|nr:RIP metalloprotease RseP [Alkaliflexus imshenetskii]